MVTKKLLLVFIAYLFLAFVYTYPLVFHLSDQTYGYSGDNLGSIHYFWWWKESFLRGQNVRNSYLEESPFGVTIDREPGTIFFYLPLKALTLVFDAVSAYNLVLILSFLLAAFSMYLLVDHLLSRPLISFLAGFIFSFSPYHFWKAYNHLDLALAYPLPLFFLALLYLERQASQARGWRTLLLPVMLLSGSWSLTVLTNFYYGYFLLLLLVAYVFSKIVVELFLFKRFYLSQKLFFSLFVAAVITLIVSLPTTAHVFLDSLKPSKSTESFLRIDSYQRPLLNLVSLSARPWDYLLPSSDHPLFGKATDRVYKWIRDQGSDFKTVSAPVHERTIYLGIINLLLLPLSVVLLIKSRLFRKNYGGLVLVLIVVIFLLFLTSMPPYVFLKGRTFYLPSYFLYKIFPMFRTYSRLGIVVLMLATVVTSMVLSYLATLFSRRKFLILTSYFLILSFVVFDFLNLPSPKTIDLTTPPSYLWLARQPGSFSVIEYPQDFNVAESLFFQRVHKKGVLNFHSQSPYFSLWEALADFRLPRTARILEALGVRFALFHKELLFPQKNPVDDLWYKRAFQEIPDYQHLPGFSLSADFPETAVLKVEESENPTALVIFSKNYNGVKIDIFPEDNWSWSGEWNNIYLVNLIQDRRINVTMSFSGSVSNFQGIREIKLNGDRVSLSQEGKINLRLKDKINELRFEKENSDKVNFEEIRLDFSLMESSKNPQEVI